MRAALLVVPRAKSHGKLLRTQRWRLVRDQRRKRLGSLSLEFLGRWHSLAGAVQTCLSSAISSSSKKLEDHDIRAPIFGMGRVMAI
jgi:hypothetical protein